MLNVTVHLGPAIPFSSRAGPRAPLRSLLALTATGARPAPLSEQQRGARRPGHGRLEHCRGAAHRSGPGPHDRPHATWHPHGRTPPPLLSFFPPSRAADRARSKTRPTRHLSTPSSLTPLWPPSRAPPPSPLFPRPDRCLWPPKASPSRWILPSTTAVIPLSGERPPSFALSKLKLILSSPFHTGVAGPHTRRRRPSELPPRWRTLLSRSPLPPPRRPVIWVRATPTRLARRHPEESLVLSGCTSPSGHWQTRHRAVPHVVTTPRTRAARATTRAHKPQRGWTGPPGRGPASLLAGRVWQAATPRGL
jgi:hypothetical protein